MSDRHVTYKSTMVTAPLETKMISHRVKAVEEPACQCLSAPGTCHLVAVDWIPVRNEVLVKIVHGVHVRWLNVDVSHIAVGDDARRRHALGQGHEAMLHAPPDHQLRRTARVLLGQGTDCVVGHPKGARQRGVRLHHNVVGLAEIRDRLARVERVHFDLVDGGTDPGLRVEQFL